ncbi:hypothetical protein DMUE_3928 [Dictyocoela muelleri]|nr:hypothetical protein DMUE_3928 [Dictyocoela muelleri]
MKFHNGKKEYFYCSWQCNIKVPYKHNTIMQGIKINYKDFIIIAYFYFYKETVTKAIMRNLNFSSTLIVKLKKRIEEKIIIHNKKVEVGWKWAHNWSWRITDNLRQIWKGILPRADLDIRRS